MGNREMRLPDAAKGLTEETSIAIAQNIQWANVALPTGNVVTGYVVQGERREDEAPLLLLHGFDSSLFEFRRLVPLLAKERQVYVVDLCGFGFCDRASSALQTKRPADTVNPDLVWKHLAAFCEQVIDNPVVLVGASMGGGVAIELTTTCLELVEKLVLLDAVGFAPAPVIGRFMFSPLDKWATNFLRAPKVRRKISENAYYDKSLVTPDAELCASLHLQMPLWQEALIAFTKSRGYGSLSEKIAQVSVDTLVLWGRQDKILGVKDAARFEDVLPQGKLVWVEECGHVPHLEQAKETADRILDFLC
ncbi:MAG: alpha/beta fold hydrolase [Cyanobacteria bacterium J06621_11]